MHKFYKEKRESTPGKDFLRDQTPQFKLRIEAIPSQVYRKKEWRAVSRYKIG